MKPFIYSLLLSVLILNINAQGDDHNYSALEKNLISNGILPGHPGLMHEQMPDNSSFMKVMTICQPDSVQCIIPIDYDTWERVPFTTGPICDGENGWTSDDCSSDFIDFGFEYNVCGTPYNGCWVNTNGNLTFDIDLGQFTPDGIPNNTAVMVAPFWTDVDLGMCGEVWIYNTENYFIATWFEVGYYFEQCDKVNTFQVVLSNGNDPIIGSGNNTAFYYCDMDWTTGDASLGEGGFGGEPATVGINSEGDNFAVIGRFDQEGFFYDGPFGENDGVDFLDENFYLFNSANCSIESSCSIFDLDVEPLACDPNGDTYDLLIAFVPAGVGPTAFIVNVGDDVYGPYPYGPAGQLTSVTIEGLLGNGEEDIEVYVYDLDDFFCGTDCVFTALVCEAPEPECDPIAGLMPSDEIIVCSGAQISATATGMVLEDGDILLYYLHDSSSSTIGAVIDINTSGSFSQGTANGSTVYYISSVVGDDLGNGSIDLLDPCTVVSLGTPVVWLNPIEFQFAEMCDWELSGDFTLTTIITGGLPEYDANQTFTVTGFAMVNVGHNEAFTISPGFFDGQVYNFSAIDALSCSADIISDPVVCFKTAIELMSFEAIENGRENLISWQTGSETDNDFFEVLYSGNGIDFDLLQKVDAIGNSSSIQLYQSLHSDPSVVSYYRLKSVDINGLSELSNIIQVRRENNDDHVSIYPNPVIDLLNIDSGFENYKGIQIFNLEGRMIKSSQADQVIDLSDLRSGIYWISIELESRIITRKFLKL